MPRQVLAESSQGCYDWRRVEEFLAGSCKVLICFSWMPPLHSLDHSQTDCLSFSRSHCTLPFPRSLPRVFLQKSCPWPQTTTTSHPLYHCLSFPWPCLGLSVSSLDNPVTVWTWTWGRPGPHAVFNQYSYPPTASAHTRDLVNSCEWGNKHIGGNSSPSMTFIPKDKRTLLLHEEKGKKNHSCLKTQGNH